MIEDEQFTQVTDNDLLRMFREERDAEHWRSARTMILEIERRGIGCLLFGMAHRANYFSKRPTIPLSLSLTTVIKSPYSRVVFRRNKRSWVSGAFQGRQRRAQPDEGGPLPDNVRGAHNALLDIEGLEEADLERFRVRYE